MKQAINRMRSEYKQQTNRNTNYTNRNCRSTDKVAGRWSAFDAVRHSPLDDYPNGPSDLSKAENTPTDDSVIEKRGDQERKNERSDEYVSFGVTLHVAANYK